MPQRTFTLATVHGDTDRAEREAYHGQQQAQLKANAEAVGQTFEPSPLVCDVTAVFTDAAGSRLEVRVGDWDEAAGLVPGAEATLTWPEA